MDFIRKNIIKTNRNGSNNLLVTNGTTIGGGGGTVIGNFLPAINNGDNTYTVDASRVLFKGHVISEGEVSAYGVGFSSGGSGSSAVTIIDNLTSTAVDCALSANQGRVLKSLIDGTVGSNELSKLQDVELINVADGQILKYNALANKWINGDGTKVTWTNIEGKPEQLTDANIINWNLAHTNSHTHTNKVVIDSITSGLTTNWNAAHTHTTDNVKHVTAVERTNWNLAHTNSHTHTNKVVIDSISATKVSNWDGVVSDWNKAFYFDDSNNLRVKLNLVGEQEVSAYGAGSTGGGGIVTIVDNLTSTAVDAALSANQGRILKSLIDGKSSVTSWNELTNKPTTLSGYGITDAPTKTGEGASGTWGIDITGSASSANSMNHHSYVANANQGVTSGLGYNINGISYWRGYSTADNIPTGASNAWGILNFGMGGNHGTNYQFASQIYVGTQGEHAIYYRSQAFGGFGSWKKFLFEGEVSWSNLIGKPSTFTPSAHVHTISEITSLQSTLDSKANASTLSTHISDNVKHVTAVERTNWNLAHTNNHVHSNKTVLNDISATKVSNWDGVVSNWNKAFYFDSSNNLRVKLNLVGEQEVSAYGAGSIGGGGGIVTIVDNLTSTAVDAALSANQGRILKSLIDGKSSVTSWNDLTNKPTTLSGYGISNGYSIKAGAAPVTKEAMQAGYWDLVGSYASFVQAGYGGQFKFDADNTYVRFIANGSINYDWRTLINSGNYKKYTVTKTGEGASGTWGINITGKASSADIATVAVSASKLSTARGINGTAFNGEFSIITNLWGATRTLSLGGDASGIVSINGSSNVTLSVSNNYATKAGSANSMNQHSHVANANQGVTSGLGYNINGISYWRGDSSTANIPTGGSNACGILNFGMGGNHGTNYQFASQIYVGTQGEHAIYYRSQAFGGFGSWKKFLFEGEVSWNSITSKPSWIGSSKPSYSWSEITSKPTTLGGYGITDAPTKTGGGASGTWNINITGDAKSLNGRTDYWSNTDRWKNINTIYNSNRTLDLRTYDSNKWYPCWFNCPANARNINRLVIHNSLDGNKPTWATHGNGFTLHLDMEFIGSGWGVNTPLAYCNLYSNGFGGNTAFGGTEQNSMGSDQILWLRGGALYYYWLNNNNTLKSSNTGYSWSSGEYSYSKAPRTTQGSASTGFDGWKKSYSNSNVASATKLQTSRSLWGNLFDGTQNVGGNISLTNNNGGIYWHNDINNYSLTSYTIAGGACVKLRSYNQLLFETQLGKMTMLGTGNVGIGTTTPSQKLHVSGNILATGEVTAYSSSDSRLKKEIKPIDSSLDLINKLNPVSFKWNDKAKELNSEKDDSTNYGLIAQELEEVLPELIHPIYNGYKSVDYQQLIPILISSIKELKNEIDLIKKQIK